MKGDPIQASDLGPCPKELERDPTEETVLCEWCARRVGIDEVITLKNWPDTAGDIFICLACFAWAEEQGMTCKNCNGNGRTKSGGECPVCFGAGIRPKEEK